MLYLLGSGVDAGVGLCSVTDAASFGALTLGVDGVEDGADESGVACNGLVIHQPDVNHAALWVCVVKGSVCALL